MTDEDEKRKQANIAAGRHPLFTSFEEVAAQRARDTRRSTPSWDDPPEANLLPDPRDLQRKFQGFFPADTNQVPTDAPEIHNYPPERETQ